MPYYEILCLAQGRLGRPELRDVVRKACTTVMEQGGVVTRVTPMGNDGFGPRKLAYRIRAHQMNHDTGYFVNLCAFANPEMLKEVERKLKLDERVLRHKVLRLPIKAALQSSPDMDAPLARPEVDSTRPEIALDELVIENPDEQQDALEFLKLNHPDPVENLKSLSNSNRDPRS